MLGDPQTSHIAETGVLNLNGVRKDPIYDNRSGREFFKLWICDIHLLVPSSTRDNAFVFRGRIVPFVRVFGTITKVNILDTRTVYEVDDGTGNINCVYDHGKQLNCKAREIINSMTGLENKGDDNGLVNGDSQEVNMKDELYDDSESFNEFLWDDEEYKDQDIISDSEKLCIEWLKNRINNFTSKLEGSYSIGETICIKGKVKDFCGLREITVYNLHVINNLRDEANHILELVHLYENDYKNFLSKWILVS